jgi:hypothetical protein
MKEKAFKTPVYSFFVSFLLLFFSFPAQVRCQGKYEVEEEKPVWLRGLLDVRIAQGGRASSWADRGPGKTRYGGRGFDRVTRIALSQVALEVGATLPWGTVGRAQINWETIDDDYDQPLLIDAYLRREWGDWQRGGGLQAGVMNLPFSLEHTGPAWTPLYTLTPSALNTWLWEEVRLVGVEGEWWQVTHGGVRLGLLAGVGFGPDQMGQLLAERGWVLSDYLSGVNSNLPLPRQRVRMSVFDEQDHRPSLYVGFTLNDPRQRGELRAGYFDNLGDQGTRGVWETRFGTFGALLRPLARVELLLQYLVGETHTRVNAWDTSFNAFYALLSFRYRDHRLSARYDVFRAHDLDGPPFSRERGDGVTLAYLFEFGLHHRVAFEYIFLHSRRPASFRSDPSDDGWQLSYRYRY